MNISGGDSIRVAIAYADIFSYSLTKEEAILWRVGRPGKALLPRVPHRFSRVALRKRRERWSRIKWIVARRAAHLLGWIPGILLVGVTGGLAMDNADKNDDIDFLCLTAKGTIWTSRFLATILLDSFGMRRRPTDQRVANKICLNMFMQDGAFALAKRDRDLFAAHEVLQMVPLFWKGDTYTQFLWENEWVKEFLPNAWAQKYQVSTRLPARQGIKYQEKQNFIFLSILRLFEPLAKRLQLAYMQKHRTSEVITDGVLRFHPHDARIWVRQKLSTRLRRLGIPLDKIFPAR